MDCKRCNGKGYLKTYVHVEGGRCYRCNGTGKEESYLKRKEDERRMDSPEGKAAYQAHLVEIRKGCSLY